MMLLITYDLNKPGQDYSGVYEELKKAPLWWHHLESTWIIETEESPYVWQERLRPSLDKNDHLLVIEICNNYGGWLPESGWTWLKERNFRC